ncbi:uncharacterized protein PFL1_05450 [Pseudozyma flocculosa PF-1]|uniref:Uncharacterized protein n=2 Tax=Pseudozyma flocculosa TaxID=84751 RepID=A0A5C3FC66_9BASI|nr:uncharacterized protein PFL1_05450 [Pseudozyma flocculosa PF-1]EPQ27169.1 hypothetical protein PFL1_05450 [Pseudozyma flocculosa PF-1]SPO41245.1 uncharacterized protein PSFLO_06727 [Pseudozyma flocculosa]
MCTQSQQSSWSSASDSPSSSSSSSRSSWGSGSGYRGRDFTYVSSGVNSQGDHYCRRDYGPDAPNQNSYHYSNADGSYYYSNPDGSTYYNNGRGFARYTPPGSGQK